MIETRKITSLKSPCYNGGKRHAKNPRIKPFTIYLIKGVSGSGFTYTGGYNTLAEAQANDKPGGVFCRVEVGRFHTNAEINKRKAR